MTLAPEIKPVTPPPFKHPMSKEPVKMTEPYSVMDTIATTLPTEMEATGKRFSSPFDKEPGSNSNSPMKQTLTSDEEMPKSKKKKEK